MKNKYNIEAIAKGEQEVDTSELTPFEALQIGLKVRQYQEDNGLLEKDAKVDHDSVVEAMQRMREIQRENEENARRSKEEHLQKQIEYRTQRSRAGLTY